VKVRVKCGGLEGENQSIFQVGTGFSKFFYSLWAKGLRQFFEKNSIKSAG